MAQRLKFAAALAIPARHVKYLRSALLGGCPTGYPHDLPAGKYMHIQRVRLAASLQPGEPLKQSLSSDFSPSTGAAH